MSLTSWFKRKPTMDGYQLGKDMAEVKASLRLLHIRLNQLVQALGSGDKIRELATQLEADTANLERAVDQVTPTQEKV